MTVEITKNKLNEILDEFEAKIANWTVADADDAGEITHNLGTIRRMIANANPEFPTTANSELGMAKRSMVRMADDAQWGYAEAESAKNWMENQIAAIR